VNTADERARQDEQFAEVFVAQGDIPAGTRADDAIGQGLIGRDEVPARSVPSGAVASLDQIAGQIVTVPIVDGEIIVTPRFGTTVAQPSGLLEIPEGLQAFTVEAGIIEGIAGHVQPGDTVSVIATLVVPSDDEDEEADGPDASRAQYVAQNATVLAVGQRVVTQEGGDTSFSTQLSNERYIFTLGMEPADIEKVVFATQQGTLWFTLVPEDQEPATTPGRTFSNLFS
jgi:pilus assembly protein CpaB